MRYIMICLRRPLFLAALLGVCLLALRWRAMATVRTAFEEDKIVVPAPTVETASQAGFMLDGNAGSDVVSTSPAEAAPAVEPSFAPKSATDQETLTQEISLQETLDRLGYTVNVPVVYDGHTLRRWNNYRVSTADDSISAERFHCGRAATFSMLGQQAICAPNTVFGCVDASGRMTQLFQPDPGSTGMWLNARTPRRTIANLNGSVRFFIEDTSHALGMDALYSTVRNNPDQTSHMLVLPALTGGNWIDEGNNRGHWEGGKSRGYLLCWEDGNDFDYQDIVILVEQTDPELPDSVAKL